MQLIEDGAIDTTLSIKSDNLYPFPFLSAYRKILSHTESGSIFYLTDGDILMPVLKKTRSGFTLLQCLFPPIREQKRLSPKDEEKFLNDFIIKLSKEHIAQRVIQSPTYALFQAAPTKSVWAPFGSFVIDLSAQEISDIWMAMKSNYRQVIRKADRENVTVLAGLDQLEVFYSLYEATTGRSGIYKEPYSYFQELAEALTAKHVYCSVAWTDGQPDGGIFIIYSQFGAYVLHAGSADFVQHPGSMKLLHWTAIQYMKQEGVQFYDFVGARLSDVSGTPLSGIQRFKSGFGSELKKGVLWKCDIDPVRCKLADTYLYFRNHGDPQIKDIIDQEINKIGA